jgi:hypothetical protein
MDEAAVGTCCPKDYTSFECDEKANANLVCSYNTSGVRAESAQYEFCALTTGLDGYLGCGLAALALNN